MRIIAGTARGLRLPGTPDDREIRPTLDRVREALFNILGPRVVGARFLDLFAGTGANGIEALSRGAAAATFLDNSQAAIRSIKTNLEAAKLADRATVQSLHMPHDARQIRGGPFDIIFADPPYAFTEWDATLSALDSIDAIVPGGILIREFPTRAESPAGSARFQRTRTAKYGDSSLAFFKPTWVENDLEES